MFLNLFFWLGVPLHFVDLFRLQFGVIFVVIINGRSLVYFCHISYTFYSVFCAREGGWGGRRVAVREDIFVFILHGGFYRFFVYVFIACIQRGVGKCGVGK